MTPTFHSDVEKCVDAVLSEVGPNIILGIPIGIGKPNHFVNALYRRAERDRAIRLNIFTGLSLTKPRATSDIERRFVGPLSERLFGGYPDLDYALALERKSLPKNIEVREFFLQAGTLLNSPPAQRGYTSLNYTHVAKNLLQLGVNVIGQLIALRGEGAGAVMSLSSNTDITLDILPELERRRRGGQKITFVAQVNNALPFMRGEAEMPASRFHHIIDDARYDFPLFAPPKEPIWLADYAAALHTAALIKDGGTIQIGIGAFADALTHALILRHTRNEVFCELVARLGAGSLHPRLPVECKPFSVGLYGATELFVDGYLQLYRAGILKRRVNQASDGAAEGIQGGNNTGALIHAGFFVGSKSFYDALKAMPDEERDAFRMTAISYVNQLYGNEALKRAQRPHARFINSAMMATLLGEAVSDQLEDGRVVSGVGGQYNFVAQAHELDDGRSIIELHATRLDKGRSRSNIRWSYGHCTIPRHLRDIFVTEYGAADVRGLSDRDTIAAMLAIADSRFQPSLLAEAVRSRKIEDGFRIGDAFRNNTPARIENALGPARDRGLLPQFPFGTDFTTEEIALLPALARLKAAQSSPFRLAALAARGAALKGADSTEKTLLARMRLESPASIKEHFYASLVLGALRSAGA